MGEARAGCRRPLTEGMRSAHPFFVRVFLPCGLAAPEVALGFVPVQQRPDLPVEGGGGPGEDLAQLCWCQVRNKKFWD